MGAGAGAVSFLVFAIILYFYFVKAGQEVYVGRGCFAGFRDRQRWDVPQCRVGIHVQDSGGVGVAD